VRGAITRVLLERGEDAPLGGGDHLALLLGRVDLVQRRVDAVLHHALHEGVVLRGILVRMVGAHVLDDRFALRRGERGVRIADRLDDRVANLFRLGFVLGALLRDLGGIDLLGREERDRLVEVGAAILVQLGEGIEHVVARGGDGRALRGRRLGGVERLVDVRLHGSLHPAASAAVTARDGVGGCGDDRGCDCAGENDLERALHGILLWDVSTCRQR
jgi:hypothetical protein